MRLLLHALLFVALLVAALLFDAWAFLRAPWGAARVARQVEILADRALAGEIRVGELGTFGAAGIRVERAVVLDPYGNPTIAAKDVRVKLDPWMLLRGRLAADVTVDRGLVEIAYIEAADDVGIGLAFAPQNPAAPAPPKRRKGPRQPLPPPPPVPIELRRLHIENTAFRVSSSPGGKPDVLVIDIGIDSNGNWDERGAWTNLVLTAQTFEPIPAPLLVDVQGAFASDWLDALKVEVRIGDTVIRARGRGEMRTLDGRIETSIDIGAAEARSYGIPLASDVSLEGDVWLSRVRSNLALRALVPEGGVAAIDGWFVRESKEAYLQVVLADFDPARWILDAPPGSLAGTARVQGELAAEPKLDFELSLREGRLAGSAVGPLAARGSVRGETLRLRSASGTIPGLSFRGSGMQRPGHREAELELRATELAKTAAFLERILGMRLPAVSGAGTAQVRLDDEALAGTLDFSRLAVEESRAEGLKLRLDGNLDGGGLPVGSVEGSADRIRTARLDATGVEIRAKREKGGDFQLDAGASTRVLRRGMRTGFRIGAEGNVNAERIQLDRFRFRYPEGELRLRGPSALQLKKGVLSLEGLELEQDPGGGSLVASGHLGRKDLDLTVHAHDLRLDCLPQQFLPEDVEGRVDLQARVRGPTNRPEGQARFDLRSVSVGTVRDFGARGDVRFFAGRVAGNLAAALGGVGGFDGSFDLPLQAMAAPPSTPVAIDLHVGPIDLEALGNAFDADLPLGTVRSRIVASGRIGRPDVQFELDASGLAVPDEPDLPALQTQVLATLRSGFAVAQIQAWTGSARVLELEASAPLDPRRLRRDFSKELRRMLASSRSRATGTIRGLDLAVLGAFLDEPELRGAVLSEFDIRGPILDPRGHLEIELRGGPLGPFRSVALQGRAEFLENRSLLDVALATGEQPPAFVRAEVGAAPRAFLYGTASPDTKVSLDIDVPALDLAALGSRAVTADARGIVRGASGKERALAGLVTAKGRFGGTLGDFRGSFRADARHLSYRDVDFGDVEVTLEQQDRLRLRIDAIDARAGTLVAQAQLGRAISPLLLAKEGTDPVENAPIRISVEGTQLSLGPLAVASQVARASGQASFRIDSIGTIADLKPKGEIHVSDGQVDLVGGPRYVGLRLDARFTGKEGELSRLEASAAGGGRLLANGKMKAGAGKLDFGLELQASSFPVGGPGGVSARISGASRLTASLTPDTGFVGELRVDRGEVVLPRNPPRNLQTVSRLPDVVIVSGPEARLRQRRLRRQEEARAVPVRLHVTARRFAVSGEDVSAQLAVDFTLLRLRTADFVGRGEVRAVEGRVRVLGRPFVLEEARAAWSDSPVVNPTLSITARYEARQATAWVDIAGPAENPTINLRSDPPLPEAQVALLIASGRTTLPGQTPLEGEQVEPVETGAAGTAVSVAGAFAATKLRQAIGPRLPLDVLTLETAGEGGTRLEAGTYLSERLYLGYLRNFLPEPGENLNEVRAEYELSRTVSLESRAGDRGSAGVDLVWEKSLPTPGQTRARRKAIREAREAEATPPGEITPGEEQQPPEEGTKAPAALEPAAPPPGTREEE